MNSVTKNILVFLLVVISLGLVFSGYNLNTEKPEIIGTSTLVEKIKQGEVERIVVQEDTLSITAVGGQEFAMKKEYGQSHAELLVSYGVTADELQALNVEVKQPSAASTILRSALPSFLFLIGFVIVFWLVMRQMQGANNRALSFGQSRAKEAETKKHTVTFKKVAGNEEAKEELAEVVEFLKHPKKFIEVGAKIPKGVLLMGPPGTGKTLLARAVAGEAKVPFFHMSGSEFVEMFVGVGASRVRDLFKKAKSTAPCIIFIDEIDAVGRQRGAGLGGGHDEREQTLNQILVEMDGFEPNSGVIVIAATNRPDVLDPALLRPGRFDRRITLDLPGLDERLAILSIHATATPLEKDVDFRRIAERTIGFSGADLMNIVNEAAILSARRGKKKLSQLEFLDAIEKVMLGPERRSAKFSDEERVLTAYHEAGHAIVGHMLPYADDVHKISIISRGMAAGYTMSLPQEDKKMHSRAEYIDQLAMILGGYATEKEIFGDVTTGPSNDLKKATAIAKRIVTRYGMSDELGMRTYGEQADMIFLGKDIHENRDYSESTAQKIDEAVRKLVDEAFHTATAIVKKHRKDMDKIVQVLLEKETIEKEAFIELIGESQKAPKFIPKAA